MPHTMNPYIPGRPVAKPELFFGRSDVIASIRGYLLGGRRVFGVFGAPRMGKSSLLRQLTLHMPGGFVPVLLELAEEDVHSLGRFLECLSSQLERDLGPRSAAHEGGDWVSEADAGGQPWLEEYWSRVQVALGDDRLVVMVDDLDELAQVDGDLFESVLSFLADWRDRDTEVVLILTMVEAWHEALLRQQGRLFGGALTYTLGPLSSEDATHLITWPVDEALTYDYGVARRMIEIASGQPYYLQLLCFELFNRCSAAGWVTQRDLDMVLEDLVDREIPEFRRIWDESRPDEQAALAALVSLRGARGVATVQEVRTILTKAGARVEVEQVALALGELAIRGILEQLGALSFRFRVGLLRDWLAQRLDLHDVVRNARWETVAPIVASDGPRSLQVSRRRDQKRTTLDSRPSSADGEIAASAARRVQRWQWIVLSVVVVLCLGLAAAALAGLFRSSSVEPTPDDVALSATLPLATATFTVPPVATEAPAEALATQVPTLGPTAAPSPTAPLVVARPVPSIAYQSRGPGETRWSIYVMSSDGSNRQRLADGQAEFLAPPAWSPDGTKLAFVSDRDGADDIWVMNNDGSGLVNLTGHEAKDHSPAWSPDGNWIAFASVRDSLYWELYMMRPDGSDVQRLTWWEDASDLSPTWSPDGTRIGFSSKRDGNLEIYTMDRDGGNLLRLTQDPADDTNPAWSPDGSRIAFESTREGYADLFVVAVAGSVATNLSRAPFSSEHGPTWSPDGGRIAFYSDREGQWDIWVMASDGSDPVRLTGNTSNDQVPAWRP